MLPNMSTPAATILDPIRPPGLHFHPKPLTLNPLQPLTGLTKETLDHYGQPLEQALATLRAHLPKTAIIVGQNIRKDIEWLGLKEGTDYGSLIDLVSLLTCNDRR